MSSTHSPTVHGKPSVLVIDDEPDLRTLYELSLVREGYEVVVADSVATGLDALKQQNFDVVVSDMRLPDGLGLEVLRFLGGAHRSERCVVITAYGSAENAVEALKAGAFDYLTKPVDLKQFRLVVAQAVRMSQSSLDTTTSQALESRQISSALGLVTELHGGAALRAIVGNSPAIVQLRERVSKVARSMAPVLIRGESGTGKELVARAIHACSHRSEGPFVAVNCGAIPENLLEAEFFGARKGAYTGSTFDREGFFQAAHGGTLFLDEIGDLPIAMQAKLLRAIQERTIRPLGDTQEVPVNARIVSATHRNLSAAVSAGEFRQDLYYRINVIDISVPALRERKEDLQVLVQHLLRRIAEATEEPEPSVSAEFLQQLESLPLKGNVRELENLLHRAMALSDGTLLALDGVASTSNVAETYPVDSPSDFLISSSGAPVRGLQAHLDEQERLILMQTLRDTSFNRTAAADRLGISLRQIRYRMARLGIEPHDIKR